MTAPLLHISLHVGQHRETKQWWLRVTSVREDGTPHEVRMHGPYETEGEARRAREALSTVMQSVGGMPIKGGVS